MRRSEQTGHTVKLLHIDSSILDGNSASRALTAGIVARWRRAMPELQVLHRDLAGTHALSHLDGASLAKSDAAGGVSRVRVPHASLGGNATGLIGRASCRDSVWMPVMARNC